MSHTPHDKQAQGQWQIQTTGASFGLPGRGDTASTASGREHPLDAANSVRMRLPARDRVHPNTGSGGSCAATLQSGPRLGGVYINDGNPTFAKSPNDRHEVNLGGPPIMTTFKAGPFVLNCGPPGRMEGTIVCEAIYEGRLVHVGPVEAPFPADIVVPHRTRPPHYVPTPPISAWRLSSQVYDDDPLGQPSHALADRQGIHLSRSVLSNTSTAENATSIAQAPGGAMSRPLSMQQVPIGQPYHRQDVSSSEVRAGTKRSAMAEEPSRRTKRRLIYAGESEAAPAQLSGFERYAGRGAAPFISTAKSIPSLRSGNATLAAFRSRSFSEAPLPSLSELGLIPPALKSSEQPVNAPEKSKRRPQDL